MKPKIKATCTKLQLQLLSFCLLCLSGKTRCDGNGPAVVTVEQDSDAVLPCSLSTKKNIEFDHFDWKKAAQKDGLQKKVFYYDAGITYNNGQSGQSEEFKGRVSHFEEGLTQGNASIIIRNTAVTDSGSYTCNFTDLQPPQTFHIKLVVDRVLKDRTNENIRGAASKPNIRTLDETDNRVPLQCEANGNPQPEVEWRDSAGNKLPAQQSVVPERDGRFFITLNTAVTKTDRYCCVATQETISHQIYTETSVRINEPVVVRVKEDKDALLPCSRNTENIEQGHFDWNKVNNKNQKEVFLYEGGRHSNNGYGSQDGGFKGRVSHFQEELKRGNASIMIRMTKMADSGTYTCTFTEPRQTFHIELVVGAASKPNIRTLNQTDNWALLQCEVHGHAEPEVEWRDSAGKTLNVTAQKSGRDGRFYVTLNTTVTKTDRYRCVATQKNISHQIYDETFVHISGNSGSGAHSSGAALKPFITILEETNDWSRLQCVVRGASPKPRVEWKDSSGNKLPAEEPQVTDRGGSYDIILQTTVTKTDYYHCVVTQEEINHQTEATIHVYISDSTGWVGIFVAVLCTVVIGGVVLAVLVYKACITLHCKKGSPADQKEASRVPLNGPPSRPQEALELKA